MIRLNIRQISDLQNSNGEQQYEIKSPTILLKIKFDSHKQSILDLFTIVSRKLNYPVNRLLCQRTGEIINDIEELQNNDIVFVHNQEETVLLTESQIQESSMSESMMDELFDDKMKFMDSFACINDVGQTETCSILFNKRQQRFNVAVIGESGVGKTSVITRHIFSKFRGEYSSTIEDFYSTFIRLNQIDSCITTAASATNTAISLEQTLTNYKTSLDSNDNQTCQLKSRMRFFYQFQLEVQMVRLDLIDTAGLEELKLVRASSLKACDGYIFIYDVNKIETLQKIDGFLEDLIKLHSTFEIDKIPLVIVGNKYDHEIILTEIYSEIDRVISTYKHQFKIQFLQCSAKRGIKIDEIFQKITLMMIKHGPTRKISKDYFYQEASMLLKEKSFIKSNGQSFQFKSHSLLKKKLSQRQKLQNFNQFI